MELWTEYEGKTIAGAFPLKKLVSPQGRSALFSTANAKGEQTLIRLVACHFDEDEILARWRGVEALKHPNFLRLERYGQLELDETKVVYAAFEHTDGMLAQVLAQGCLSVADTRQLAASVISALEMLHANGFVHEHIAPESVFAVGEVVKLRTDCIRETPEGEDGRLARKRDVRDLATLLLQALTQERTLEAAQARRRRMPAPFEEIVSKAIAGELELGEIGAALQVQKQVRKGPLPVAAEVPAAAVATSRAPESRPASTQSAAKKPGKDDITPAALRSQKLPGAWREESLEERRKWIGAAAAVAVLILMLWAGVRFYNASGPAETHASAKTGSVPHTAHSSPLATAKPSAAAILAQPPSREVWRVVVYTYDRRQEAEQKATELAQRMPRLRPAVFTATGHAPFLVTVGGAMSRSQAYALAKRSHGMGLPRDSYAQNYRNGR